MTNSTPRRKFLSLAASAAGASASLGLLPLSLQKALAAPIPSGTLADVEHVVILVQENRSFDHYFGTLGGVRGFSDPHPQRFLNGSSVFSQPSGSSTVLPFRASRSGVTEECVPDLAHDWATGHQAWNSGKYDAWIAAKGTSTMCHYTRADIPFHFALADQFTVCDQYFCSTASSTAPNRLYVWTGTSGGETNGGDAPGHSWTWTTYAELMQNAGISWQTYQEQDNYGDNALDGFKLFNTAPTTSPLYQRGIKRSAAGMSIVDFKADIMANKLPAVSYIVGPANTTEHPSYSLSAGANYIHSILDALASNLSVWEKTVFILTYDENGGFFDHVAPPSPPTESFQSSYRTAELAPGTNTPYGLGSRVPTMLISPWSRGGRVCSETFDHTSINRFLEKWIKARFKRDVLAPNITPWRKTICGDLTSALNFGANYTPDPSVPVLPRTDDKVKVCSVTNPVGVPGNQVLLSQEPGAKVLQALPYQLNVSARPDKAGGRLWLDMSNAGSAGCAVNVVVNEFRAYAAWSYVVPAGTGTNAPVTDYFSVNSVSSGKFDMSAYGPNGFTRRYRGDLAKYGIEITAAYDSAANRIILNMKNTFTSGNPIEVRVCAGGYRSDGPWSYQIAAGATVSDSWYTKDGWYDLVAFIPTDSSFLRGFSGHIEGSISKTLVSGVLPRTVAKVIAYDSQTVSGSAAKALDDNPMNAWTSADSAFPHYLTVDLGGVRQVNGLSYLPKQEQRSNIYEGNIANYQVLISLDAINWSLMGQGTWTKTLSMSSVNFSTVNARYVKLLALSEVNGARVVAAAEVRVLGS